MERNSVVVSGSFRKHLREIRLCIKELKESGYDVLSPRSAKASGSKNGFVILETDESDDPRALERSHLAAIAGADALYVCNPEGYVGASATMELGFALALGKPVFSMERIADVTLGRFCAKASIAEMTKALARKGNALPVEGSSLPHMQAYFRKAAVERGFGNETSTEIMLLMIEEVGELAKSLRKLSGLKYDTRSRERISAVEDELADVLIYLLHLSNSCDVDLFKAFVKKEKANAKRTWASG